MRTVNFEELDLNEQTLNQLKTANLNEATSLQQSIISTIADEQSLVIKAEEADEKYSAIAIASLEKLNRSESETGTKALIITSSPQNAAAVNDKLSELGIDENERTVADDDGEIEEQAEALSKEPSVIIANPARLQSLLQEHRFIFRQVKLLVLDDLHSLVNDEQSDNLKRIKRRVLSDYCTLMCTADYDSKIKNVASLFAKEPTIIGFGNVGESQIPDTPPSIAGHIKQGYINVPYRMKITTLMAHLDNTDGTRFVIFTASKRGTDRLYRVLKKRNLKATSLHGKLSDEKRAQRFSNFTNGDVNYLLVADISAATLDLNDIDQVINYDVPNSSDEYRFRAALLGSGSNARLVSLVSKQDRSDISELQNELGQTPDEIPLPDEVKEQLKKRKQSKSSNGKQKKGGRQKKNKKDEMQLPRPSYDKLSGGRTGDHNDEKTGIVKFFKKLFTS